MYLLSEAIEEDEEITQECEEECTASVDSPEGTASQGLFIGFILGFVVLIFLFSIINTVRPKKNKFSNK